MDHLLEAASMREPTPTSELPTSELPAPELSAPVVAADASGLIIQVAALPLEVPTSAETTPLPLEGVTLLILAALALLNLELSWAERGTSRERSPLVGLTA